MNAMAGQIEGTPVAKDSFVTALPDGLCHLDLAVDGMHCAGCMRKIEKAVGALPGVTLARVNLTEKRLAVEWAEDAEITPTGIVDTLRGVGFAAHPFDPGTKTSGDGEDKRLIKAMAVAGFAAMNIMLLSVSVWSGNVTDIASETRDLFHWISALIALPAVAYAGRPFFDSAVKALRARSLNMDVPISLAVLLALFASVLQTMRSAEHAYFDSAVMLLFFLLVGRTLDQVMRRRTRNAAETLLALKGESADRVDADGAVRTVPLSALGPGDRVHVAQGMRFPADGAIDAGEVLVDQSLVTGETDPVRLTEGDPVYAGALAVEGAATATVTAAGSGTLLDEINRLMERALENRSRYLRLADRAAKAYAPAVHILAALAFVGWLAIGAPWHQALMIAVAVLIITCPCALGLAVPAAQVVASGALFKAGLVVNAGDMLERLADVDTVVFDKTGTLTLPSSRLQNADDIPADILARARRLAGASRHPLARALAGDAAPIAGAVETPGEGVTVTVDGIEVRLGSPAFCGDDTTQSGEGSIICYREGSGPVVHFRFGQTLRSDALETVAALKARGLSVEILSGDRDAPVRAVAEALDVDRWTAGTKPADKIARLKAHADAGRKVLMVGDGLNDAPSLAAAHASLSPISAVHVSQAAADGLILGERLWPVVTAVDTARRASRVMRENIAISFAYNIIAVPIAVFGFVTPLIAAIAMSASSIVVTLNSLRAKTGGAN